jgi:hypothetical protein
MRPQEIAQIIRTVQDDLDTLLTNYGTLSDDAFHTLTERIEESLTTLEKANNAQWEKQVN